MFMKIQLNSLALILSFFLQASAGQDVRTLEPGKPIEREIAGGQRHIYTIALPEGLYAKVTVEQRGIDLSVRAFGVDGKLIAEFDSEIRNQGVEKIELVAAAAQSCRLEVEAKLKIAPLGGYEIRVAELHPASEAERALQEARVLLAESQSLSRAGKYQDALAAATGALGIREKILGTDDPAVALIFNRMGMLNYSLRNNAESEALFKRALQIYEKRLGPDDVNISDPLNNMAGFYTERGEFAEAEALLQRALAIREEALGPDHFLVAITLNNLGKLNRRRGDNARAELLYERSLDIRERTLGLDHLDLTPVLDNLATLYYYKGDYTRTLAMDRRTLEIREKNLGKDHPGLVDNLSDLALVHAESGEIEKAERLYLRALDICEKNFGRDHIRSKSVLANLANLYKQRGEYAKAESFYQRTLQILEKHQNNDLTWQALFNYEFGGLYLLMGDYAKAEPLLERALAIRERALGTDHYDIGRSLDALALLYALKGEVAQAVSLQARANQISEKNIALNLAIGSEHQRLAYMSLMSESLNQTIALHAQMAREDRGAREQAVTALLQRKGRVLDAMTNTLAALRQRFDAQDRGLFDRLRDTNAQLAELSLNAPPPATLANYQQQTAALTEQKERLEKELSRRSAGFYESPQPVKFDAIRALIPGQAALIEFAAYRPLNRKANDAKADGAPRYVAYVIRRQGDLGWAELGDARAIDEAIEAWREALRDPKRRDARQLARALDEKLMQPVRPLLGDASHLLISPEGALNLIPFEALVDEQNRYLVERFAFTYLTSGRDLLRMQVARASKSQPLVLANPSFGEPELLAVTKPNAPPSPRASLDKRQPGRTKRQSVTSGSDLSSVYFAPLPGTAQEAQAIKSLFAEADLLTGARATESSLKQISAPRIMHIATHGFFLTDAPPPSPNAGGEKTLSISANLRIENPLLRSGLALAGANLRKSSDDGILTAMEASGLNLWGTKLVTLSACDTGLGEVKNGEGVYGLRRAFALAGTEALVMSLWPVSDYVTRELMTAYYQGLKQGQGRGEALRQVQLSLLKRRGREHPFYWASFIQSGEWANLDGKR
jgi:CHAT domain-containing protein/Tfp pilus assembly protein PilF